LFLFSPEIIAMSFPVRFTISLLIFIGLLVIGFMYLMRGCLSKYDERSVHRRVLYFENAQQKVIFSVVKFEKTTSYSRSGGFINKTVNVNYSVQNNDAVSGNKINEKKVKNHRDIKNHPVEILGASGNLAWVFMNEPMAFDPFTLETVADLSILEAKNPALIGKFPAERRFYRFDNAGHNLYFTARDGSAWMMDGKTFLATAQESVEEGSAGRIKQLDKLIKANYQQQDSLMENKLRRPSRQLSAKEIDMKTYQRMMASFSQERQQLSQQRDSLQELKNGLEKTQRADDDLRRRIVSLQGNLHFNQIKVNADTTAGNWFGLYSTQEMEELYDHFSYQPAYNEAARRQWHTSTYARNKYGDMIIAKESAIAKSTPDYFLNGGLLLHNQTAKPVRLADGSFLVIYKNQVGNEGKILLARIMPDGKMNWSFDSALTEWSDYVFTQKQLFITGKDNKELSSDDCNVLWLVNLENGKAEKYDFFEQKKLSRTAK
jgi:hypothetical protein